MTTIPETGWSYDEGKNCLVENDDPTAFGAGGIRFEVRASVDDFDFYKDNFEDYQDIEERVIDGITFRGRTYKNIGYEWIELSPSSMIIVHFLSDCVIWTVFPEQ